MNDVLVVSDYNELLSLHKAIIEAKFSENLIHMELPGSSFLAHLSNQVVEILIKKDSESGRDNAEIWKKWRSIDDTRREWHVSIKYLTHYGDIWMHWTKLQKEEFVHVLLSPYIISSELLDSFIEDVDIVVKYNNP